MQLKYLLAPYRRNYNLCLRCDYVRSLISGALHCWCFTALPIRVRVCTESPPLPPYKNLYSYVCPDDMQNFTASTSHLGRNAIYERCFFGVMLYEAQEYLSRQPVGFGGPSVEGIRQWGLWWYGAHYGIRRSNICYKLGGWFFEGRTPRLMDDCFTILASWVPLNSNMMVVVLIRDGQEHNN